MRRPTPAVAILALTALAALGCTSPPASTPAGSTPPPQPPAAFTAWLTDRLPASGVPGISIAVVRDHELAWAAGFGLADMRTGRPVTAQTSFQAASVSKAISAIAIVTSYRQHGISLTDPLAPLDLGPGEPWTVPNPFPQPVTPRLLLSHTGGIVPFHYSGFREGVDVIPTMRQELDGLPPATTPPIRVVTEPGTVWSYAPGGYTILQAQLEQQTGQPFAQVMHDQLLAPVGATTATFTQPPPATVTAQLAVPYLPDGTPLPGGPRVFNTEASGGLVATPTDLARVMIAFQDALAGRPSPIDADVAAAMMERQPGTLPDGACLPTADPDRPACLAPQGLGFDVNLDATFTHLPDDEPTGEWFGHSGFNSGYLAFFVASKEGGNGYVVMANAAPADMATSDIPELGFLLDVMRRLATDNGWA